REAAAAAALQAGRFEKARQGREAPLVERAVTREVLRERDGPVVPKPGEEARRERGFGGECAHTVAPLTTPVTCDRPCSIRRAICTRIVLEPSETRAEMRVPSSPTMW